MTEIPKRHSESILKTQAKLQTIATSKELREFSNLELPEVESIVERISQALPAGNVPGMILSGLARLQGRKLPNSTAKRDINLLFKGMETSLDKAVYSAFFAGPAAVIWGYQNILKLAGKDPQDAFPEGVWQFYVDYALREDTARHANETHGFDTMLQRHHLRLPQVDRMASWVMAAVDVLHQYDELLKNEWRERVYIRALQEVVQGQPNASQFDRLFRRWEVLRPYRIDDQATGENTASFSLYRRDIFDQFILHAAHAISPELRKAWGRRVEEIKRSDLPAYLQQMSILTYLEPDRYGEQRVPLKRHLAHVGVVYQHRYYVIPIFAPGTENPVTIDYVREKVAAILHNPASVPAANLQALARLTRYALHELRGHLNQQLREGLESLRLAPILLNFDTRPAQLPLAEIRQTERGVGDHAVTVFDTGRTFVFDLSHIFFDGGWGAAFSEIMTNQALTWAVYLSRQAPPVPANRLPYTPLLPISPAEAERLRHLPQVVPEASAESSAVNLKSVLALRHTFKRRSDFLRMTVNDLLILYRAIHAATYSPSPRLVERLKILQAQPATQAAATAALHAFDELKATNPAILIPIDASKRRPRDRVHPLSFEVPLNELHLIELHERVNTALEVYGVATHNRQGFYDYFESLQKEYLSNLAAFGQLLGQAKQIAAEGSSSSAEAIRLLAHMPVSMQRWLDKVPEQFDLLNDLIKGREVLSNVGEVVKSSSLSRFITAKDDNEKKTLAWGILTDANGNMHLSLRDFRPHVRLLIEAGQRELANQIAQEYLDHYAAGLNRFVRELRSIALSRPVPRPLPKLDPTLSAQDTLLGRSLGDYQILSAIHYSDATKVYAGQQRWMRLPVIIKVIDAKTPEQARQLQESLLKVSQWDHLNIVRVLDVGVFDHHCYMVREYVPGYSLAERLYSYAQRGAFMPYEEIIDIAGGLGEALEHAHEQGIIHANLKPDNILLTPEQVVKVQNFGLAVAERRQPLGGDYSHPYYIAPEQVESSRLVMRTTDIYSLGVIFYEMLTGVVPFDHPTPQGLGFLHQSYEPLSPQEIKPFLLDELTQVLMKALRKSPRKRYATVGSFVRAFQTALRQQIAFERPQVNLPQPPTAPHRPTHSALTMLHKDYIPSKITRYLGRRD